MGTVFRASDETTQRPIAIKVFDGRSAVEIERARREVEVLSKLDHPAIVRPISDGVTPDGRLFLAMEWIDGVTVADVLSRDGLTVREAVAITRRIASALAAAHAAGILHRDIKPTNILLAGGDPSAAMLIDFGIARIADAVHALTRTGMTLGTPGYMAPEQARGDRALRPCADIFALGCVLYECATARPAFSGSIAIAVMAKILFAQPVRPTSICAELPPALEALIDRMIEKDVGRRLADCGDVIAAIDALGALPDGPRRSARGLTLEPTAHAAAEADVHCIVGAARGEPNDLLEPPSDEQRPRLAELAARCGARLEIAATGAVLVHLHGAASDTTRRAAALALAMRDVLPGWAISVSSAQPDLRVVSDAAGQLLSRSALAAILAPVGGAITVERGAASLLADDFEVELPSRGDPRLHGARKR